MATEESKGSESQEAQHVTEAQGERSAVIKALVGGASAEIDPGQGLLAQMTPVSGEAPPDAPPAAPVAAAPATSTPDPSTGDS
jgi:hypothetical protein